MDWLAFALLFPIALLALLVLMQWLERTHTRHLIVDDVTEFLSAGRVSPDDVEQTVAQRAALLVEAARR